MAPCVGIWWERQRQQSVGQGSPAGTIAVSGLHTAIPLLAEINKNHPVFLQIEARLLEEPQTPSSPQAECF